MVAPEGREEEAVTRLSRVGFDNTLGFLKGSFNSWKEVQKEYDTLSSVSPQQFAENVKGDIKIVDVRKPSEYQAEHVENAENVPLDFLNERLAELPTEDSFYVHCAGGYRSVIASSILKARGMHNMINVEGGFDVLRTIESIPTTDYVCPSTLK